MPADKLILDRLDHAGYVDLFNCYRIVAGMVPEAPAPELTFCEDSPLAEAVWNRGGVDLGLSDWGGGAWPYGVVWSRQQRGEGCSWSRLGDLREHARIAAALRRLFELA